jgi:hypothetical protein
MASERVDVWPPRFTEPEKDGINKKKNLRKNSFICTILVEGKDTSKG